MIKNIFNSANSLFLGNSKLMLKESQLTESINHCQSLKPFASPVIHGVTYMCIVND